MHDRHPLPGEDEVVDGVRLHYVRHGRDDADHPHPPIVLLHGMPTSSYIWHDVMRDLGHEHRTLAPDLVGFGRSERPPALGYDLASQARLLWRLLDRLRLRRVVLVGHELGAAVAAHLTALDAGRVAGLVLVNAIVHADAWPSSAALPLLVPGVRTAYVNGLRRAPALAEQELARRMRSGLPDDEVRRHLAPLLTRDGARGLLAFARAVDLDAAEAAWRLVCADPPPSLVIWGERGYRGVSYGRRVASEVASAGWVPVDGGPLLPQERPERVAEEVAGFVADLTVAAR